MDRKAAERRAFLEFGNVAAIEETSRDVRGRWLDDFVKDASLRPADAPAQSRICHRRRAVARARHRREHGHLQPRQRGLAAAAAGPRAGPARADHPADAGGTSRPTCRTRCSSTCATTSSSISGAFAHGSAASDSIVIDGEQEFVIGGSRHRRLLRRARRRPAAGRLLGPADDTLAVAVAGGRHQRSATGSAGSAAARRPSAHRFTMRDRVFTIVGVMPASFRSVRVGAAPDLVLPLLLTMQRRSAPEPTNNFLKMLARLKPDATVEQASAESQALWKTFIEPLAAKVPGGLRAEVSRSPRRRLPVAGRHQRLPRRSVRAASAPDGHRRASSCC